MDESSEVTSSQDRSQEKAEAEKPVFRKIESATDVMFRNVVSTHVEFTYIADHKAYLMITINSLVLAGLSTVLIPQLDQNGWLILPTVLLSLVCLSALTLSIIAVRPSLGKGITTRESISERRANLLFFGNFHKMSLKDFDWGMHELLDDEELLVSNMVRDVYFLGKSLGSKYKFVKASYTVFLWGMLTSIFLFLLLAILNFYGAV